MPTLIFEWGMRTGPLLPDTSGLADTFEVWNQDVFYTWETGANSWNKLTMLLDDQGAAVVFDPPRAGAGAQASRIAESKVPLVIGVACDTGTFARDAATLVAGGYTLERVIPVDQFAYSGHLEMVGVFRRPRPPRKRL